MIVINPEESERAEQPAGTSDAAFITTMDHFSTTPIISKTAPTPSHSIYLSTPTNPYFNLSFEDWLFRHALSEKPLLLLYRDDPCVVIGRNQNPWKEVNFVALNEQRIPWIRRRSGGGTVYHDLGNTNFSVHLPRASFDRHMTAQVVLRAVQSMGIPAYVNERNDLCVGEDKICLRFLSFLECRLTWFLSLLLPLHFHLLIAIRFVLLPVSGSAYKIVNKRAYHHGTMLISTKLNTLGEVLKPGKDKDAMETKGVASVRSPVRNLQQSYEEVTHDRFVQAVAKVFREEYGVDSEGTGEIQVIGEERYRDVEYIQKGMNELKSWEWAYGQTPEFTYTIQKDFDWGIVRAKIRSKHGIILDCDCSVDHSLSFDDMSLRPGNVSDANTQNEMEKISTLFRGRKYGVSGPRVEGSGGGTASELVCWLEKVVS
ncbi:hypothetical protein D9757_001081 [Collybiopsis confluens]|uniref:Putative lipoate-protein ligase A n=1 Tax=Collybiopsis confluens TaxID=2823264 RepID=A0A8H5I0L3_9AGAR|nr:hypothetical protein D9757_001081 [Collybiopsis confluens]